MKKQTFVLWALTGMLAVPASAQVDYKTRAIGQSIAIRSVCVIWG